MTPQILLLKSCFMLNAKSKVFLSPRMCPLPTILANVNTMIASYGLVNHSNIYYWAQYFWWSLTFTRGILSGPTKFQIGGIPISNFVALFSLVPASSLSPRFGPKRNSKLPFDHHPHKTFERVIYRPRRRLIFDMV